MPNTVLHFIYPLIYVFVVHVVCNVFTGQYIIQTNFLKNFARNKRVTVASKTAFTCKCKDAFVKYARQKIYRISLVTKYFAGPSYYQHSIILYCFLGLVGLVGSGDDAVKLSVLERSTSLDKI